MTNPLAALPENELRHLRETHTLQEIGDRYGCSREYVRQICERHGIIVSGQTIHQQRTQATRQRALARVREVGIAQTSRELGVPRCTLHSWGAAGLSPRKWPTDRLIAAGKEWERRYGAPPTVRDWQPAMALATGREDLAERYRSGDWPSANWAIYKFGKWNTFIRACGFDPISPHNRRHQGRVDRGK